MLIAYLAVYYSCQIVKWKKGNKAKKKQKLKIVKKTFSLGKLINKMMKMLNNEWKQLATETTTKIDLYRQQLYKYFPFPLQNRGIKWRVISINRDKTKKKKLIQFQEEVSC